MEAAQHDPDGGERAPGALEDGDDASSGAPEVPSAAANEAPQDQGTSANEGPYKSRAWAPEGPSGDPTSRGGETCHAGGPGAAEGPCGARCSPGRRETPGRTEEREVSGAREEPDISGEQRHGTKGPPDSGTSGEGPPDSGTSGEGPPDSGTSGEGPPDSRTSSEGPPDSRTSGEGPRSPGASSPSEPGREERHPQPAPTGGSFKKPVAPGGPAGREKTMEPPRDQPTRPPGHPAAPHGQTAPVICPRLPSDASRAAPALPYQEPPWSGRPEALYSLEVLKGGAILSTKDLREANWTAFGRLPTCHVSLEHPSVSRYHAVLQYRVTAGDEPDQQRGFYIYDLGSTHGTFVNKQRIPPKAYHRVRVGHVMKFGGSTRLFILQGPDDDQEAESELTVTQIKEARRQMENLQKRMLGDDSDEEDEPTEEGKKEKTSTGEESGCMWGMGEDAIEDESEENPIAMEFQEDREALYLKNPKKALQGFFDREGEELEFEYDERGPGSWICRVKLPADDSAGKQLVAEVTHTGKKKEAANLCALEACRMLDMRGLLRQEAVSRKRKAKKWEDEDFYDSDDDTFLDRTGIVEKKRLNRMKKAGKIEEKPETFESLTAKLELVEKEIAEVATKLRTSQAGVTQSSAQDSLDAFMTEIKAGSSLDSVSRKKLHIQSLELKKEQQRLKSLIKIVQPTKLPELKTNSTTEDPKAKKLTLPLFGAMKGGSKFKLKTGTVGRLPPKRTDLPPSLFTMKDTDEPEEEEEDEDEEMKEENPGDDRSEDRPTKVDTAEHTVKKNPVPETQAARRIEVQRVSPVKEQEAPESSSNSRSQNGQKQPAPPTDATPKTAAEKQKRMHGPSKPPQGVLGPRYPEDDPDYCVWTPPAGQTGDGKTHLNEKYGY